MRCYSLCSSRSGSAALSGPADFSGVRRSHASNLLLVFAWRTLLVMAALLGVFVAATSGAHAQGVTGSAPSINLGSQPVGVKGATQIVTFTFQQLETVSAVGVYTEGVAGKDFQAVSGSTCVAGAAYNMGQSCTVLFSFTPATAGVVRGAVELMGSGNVPLATSYVYGTGTGGVLAISGGTTTLLGTASSAVPNHAVTDRQGNVYTVQVINSVPEVVEYTAQGSTRVAASFGSGGIDNPCCGIAWMAPAISMPRP